MDRVRPFEAGGSVYPIDFIKLSLPLLCLIKATAPCFPPDQDKQTPSNRIYIVPHFSLFLGGASTLGAALPRLSRPSTFKTPTVPSIIAMKLSTKPTKLHLTDAPLGCPFDKSSSWMKWPGYRGRLWPRLERSRNEVSSWHTGGRKTSNHG